MVTISIDELVKAYEAERNRAEAWRVDCAAHNSTMLPVATQKVLDFNTAILLAKGMKTYEVEDEHNH